MSEELQNETLSLNTASTDITETASSEVIENSQAEPELATETQNEAPKVELTAEEVEAKKEEKRQAAFNHQYGVTKQLERDVAARDAKIAELEQSKQPEKPPELGEFPLEYDFDTEEEFNTAKQNFVANVQANERFKANLETGQTTQQQNKKRARQQQQERFNKDMISYTESARRNNIKPAELQQAADAVNSYGMTEDLSLAILADPDGPLITKYLAANPVEVSNLVNMNPYAAGAHLNELKAKAAALKPKQSNTPQPTADITGSSPKPPKHPELEGVIYS